MSKPYLAVSILLAVTSLFLVALAAPGTTIETAYKVWVECDANAETILDVEILRNGKPFDKLEFSLKQVAAPPPRKFNGTWFDTEEWIEEFPGGGHRTYFACACGGGGGRSSSYGIQEISDQGVSLSYSSSWHLENEPAGNFSREFLFPVGKKTELQLSDGFAVRANFRAPQ